jgi:adenylate cyclase class 2
MPLEIEAKMKVDDLAALRRRLAAAGAKRAGEYLETNTFYDTPGASLRRAGRGLRLRANRDVRTGRTTHIVTFKGPRRAGPLKKRMELEFAVDDPAAFARVLKELGFVVSIRFRKRRQSWKLRGCSVDLDQLPSLGCFVEIEGPGDRQIMRVRTILGLADRPLIVQSYAALMARRRQR